MRMIRYLALLWLVSLAFLTVSAPWLPLASYEMMDFLNEAQFPDASNWLGTDGMGRDMFSRVVHGAQVSLAVAIASPFIGLLLGGCLGLLAGYFRGWLEQMALIIIDTMLAFPALIFALNQAVQGHPRFRSDMQTHAHQSGDSLTGFPVSQCDLQLTGSILRQRRLHAAALVLGEGRRARLLQLEEPARAVVAHAR